MYFSLMGILLCIFFPFIESSQIAFTIIISSSETVSKFNQDLCGSCRNEIRIMLEGTEGKIEGEKQNAVELSMVCCWISAYGYTGEPFPLFLTFSLSR